MPLQYIGFWPGSVSAGGSLLEQRGFANVTKALSLSFNTNAQSWGDVDAEFALAREHGQRVLMNLPESDDYALRFPEWSALIGPYHDQIDAFFIMDEPDCASGGNATRLQQLLGEIEQKITRVHQHFPGAPTMITLGCFNANLPAMGFYLPAGVTDIALQCYHGRGQWEDWLSRLTPYLTKAHRLWLMPWAYGSRQMWPYFPTSDEEVIYEASVLYDYAKTDERVVGLLPFAWYDGIRDRPKVREYFAQIGREILEQRLSPPTDRRLRLDAIVPREAFAGRPFTLAFLGQNFAPTAVVQYSTGGPFQDYPAVRSAENVMLIDEAIVGPGRYALRVKNPDGETTQALAIDVMSCR